MGLERIEEEVIESGKKKAEEIINEGRNIASEILRDAGEKAKKIIAEKNEEVQRTIKKMRAQELSSTELEVKRAKLFVKKEAIDELYKVAIERIKKIPIEKDEGILKKILEKVENGCAVYSNKRNEIFIQKYSNLRYCGNIDAIGGVLIESSDGLVRRDFTYETILKEVFDKWMKDIADKLFKDVKK
ncbi:MAG: V-type ATP synthase subunit E family protein [Candidatus Thermoplasmatota archaeon]